MISISATNPCHLYDLALELFDLGALHKYYSGYPRWKLKCPQEFPLHVFSARTVAVYAALKLLPHGLRPRNEWLFRWQDEAFDKSVSRTLEESQFLHAMPGQCLQSFRAAKRRGIRTVLNHAAGPVAQQRRIENAEYIRLGLPLPPSGQSMAEAAEREREEYRIADYHCVASRIVKQQLIQEGVDEKKIGVIPYGANPNIFRPGTGVEASTFRIIFAGQITVRKGLHFLLEALECPEARPWTLDIYGRVSPDIKSLLARYRPTSSIHWHGPVTQLRLAAVFREGSLLVLPSLEEGFGLVVPQAMACGVPCVVSDRVGASDLIQHQRNGSIVPAGDVQALRRELIYWRANGRRVSEDMSWREPALRLVKLSETIFNT
jgi:glycosyltransferase involved in cell wall biosynthesis